jgi:hypothetical protein
MTFTPAKPGRWDILGLAAAGALIIFGAFSISFALLHQAHAPMPSLHTDLLAAPPIDTAAVSAIPFSPPTSIRIPTIGVSSPVASTGLNADGTPIAPAGPNVDKAAWLTTSASPGTVGTSVIIGHVDTTRSGPSVFYNLGKLTAGQKLDITREDGRTAVFTVTSVHSYPKNNFPNDTVYRNTQVSGLRLITCGGSWDARHNEYSDNIVAFAVLTGTQ